MLLNNKILLNLALLTYSSIATAKHHHAISIDTTPEYGLTIERDTYAQGSYYYPTFTQSYGEFSVGLSGQNLSTWDNQDGYYLIGQYDYTVTDTVDIIIGSYTGSSTISKFTLDSFNYLILSNDISDNLSLQTGVYTEQGYVNMYLSGVITYGKFSIQPTYVPGTTNMAGSSVNLQYNLNDNFQPYIGWGYAGDNYLAIGFNFNED